MWCSCISDSNRYGLPSGTGCPCISVGGRGGKGSKDGIARRSRSSCSVVTVDTPTTFGDTTGSRSPLGDFLLTPLEAVLARTPGVRKTLPPARGELVTGLLPFGGPPQGWEAVARAECCRDTLPESSFGATKWPMLLVCSRLMTAQWRRACLRWCAASDEQNLCGPPQARRFFSVPSLPRARTTVAHAGQARGRREGIGEQRPTLCGPTGLAAAVCARGDACETDGAEVG